MSKNSIPYRDYPEDDYHELAKKHSKRYLDEVQYTKKRMKDPRSPMKKALTWIKDFVRGKNKAGETVHGILDVLPLPNQAIAKIAGYFFEGDKYKAKEELQKLLTVRNGVALIAAILLLTGVISFEDIERFLSLTEG